MNPLIKQNKFDLNRIEPAILEEMKSYSDKGELYGLPYTANFTALLYLAARANMRRRLPQEGVAAYLQLRIFGTIGRFPG
jgi:hypothetical protein